MTPVPFLDLRRQTDALRPELDSALADVLDEGRYVLGPPVEEFERAFADYCGASHAVGVASGTDAITIALQAVGVGPGDEVVVPANTTVPTVAGVEAAGAVPVLADVDPMTYTLDPGSVARALTNRTRALLPVHLYGQCADVPTLLDLARAHGLKLVEDAAQAHGAEIGGHRTGSLGDAAAFSFYPTKNLGALGDGGAVVTDDPAVAEEARRLRSYGERERYDSVRSGWNSRLDTLQAALLLVKLPRLEGWNERRRQLAARYDQLLAGTDLVLPIEAEGRRHAYHLYVVRARWRDDLAGRLAEQGVQTLVHYPRPIHRHAAYRRLARHLPVSERLCDEVLSLPLYPEFRDDEVERVVEALSTCS
jgi:dTDP-3-amino-3,4,6-trideoxy-alpha-D-glucose transaminase